MHNKKIEIVSTRMVKESSVPYSRNIITTPKDVVEIVNELYNGYDREMFIVICLNSKNEPTAINPICIGTLSETSVHPRDVFKLAILSNSSSIMVVHNHPSGDPTPSKADFNTTEILQKSGEILGIPVVDHIIIGENNKFYSFYSGKISVEKGL